MKVILVWSMLLMTATSAERFRSTVAWTILASRSKGARIGGPNGNLLILSRPRCQGRHVQKPPFLGRYQQASCVQAQRSEIHLHALV
jgi:hypothetical protein